MVGGDEHAIAIAQRFCGQRRRLVAVVFSDKGVVVADAGALEFEQFQQPPARRLTGVVDVAFVGHSQNQDVTAANRLAVIIERPE